ncbi:MAG: hypothetical protein RR052_02140, partial [Oscillospiraceae bacterium]
PFSVHILPDSDGYIVGAILREPLYPLIIMFFKSIFGEGFATPLFIFQNLLLSYSIWSLCLFLQEKFKLSKLITTLNLGAFVAILAVQPFLSASNAVYSSTVLSEGITFALFFLIARFLLKAAFELSFKPLIPTGILVFIAILTRFQMAYTLVLWLLVAVFVAVKTKTIKKYILPILIATVGIFALTSVATKTYHFFKNDAFVSTQFKDTSFLAKLVYTSEKEDADLFQTNPLLKETFLKIYENSEKLGYLQTKETATFIGNCSHYEPHFDKILAESILPLLYNLAFDEINNCTPVDARIFSQKMAAEMNKKLFVDEFPSYLALSANSAVFGLIRSNSFFQMRFPTFLNVILTVISFVGYAGAFVLIFLVYKKRRSCNSPFLNLFIIVSLLGNMAPYVLAQYLAKRYTTAFITLFWFGLLILVCEFFRLFFPNSFLSKHFFNIKNNHLAQK